MSILLEALKQKNSQSEPSKTISSGLFQEDSKARLVTDNSLKPPLQVQPNEPDQPMEALISMLDIEPPPGLDWQLTPNTDKSVITSDETQPLAESETQEEFSSLATPHSFKLDLIMPTMSIAEYSNHEKDDVLSNKTDSSDEVEPSNTLVSLHEKHDVSIESLTLKHIENREPETVLNKPPLFESITQGTQQVIFQPKQQNEEIGSEEPMTIPIIKPIELPKIEKTPLSAQRFLSFARKLKLQQKSLVDDSVAEPALAAKGHNYAHHFRQPLLISAGIVVGVVILVYTAHSVWESQQLSHLQQIARFTNQNLTELPEHPVISTPTSETASINEPLEKISTELFNEPIQPQTTTKLESGFLPIPILNQAQKSKKTSATATILDTSNTSTSANKSEVSLLQSHPTSEWLFAAYESYEKGDLKKAEYFYRLVLEKQPYQRDALLGMLALAQIDVKSSIDKRDLAEQLRNLYPNDKEVNLATDVILNNTTSEQLSESELKQLQRNVAYAGEASFRLGLLLAEQQRWNEAQSAFFEALKTMPNHSGYLMNLAISYDHLAKHQLAVEYYQQLLTNHNTKLSPHELENIRQRLNFLLPFIKQES